LKFFFYKKQWETLDTKLIFCYILHVISYIFIAVVAVSVGLYLVFSLVEVNKQIDSLKYTAIDPLSEISKTVKYLQLLRVNVRDMTVAKSIEDVDRLLNEADAISEQIDASLEYQKERIIDPKNKVSLEDISRNEKKFRAEAAKHAEYVKKYINNKDSLWLNHARTMAVLIPIFKEFDTASEHFVEIKGKAEQASVNANEVAGAAEEMSTNMNTVAAAIEEMSASINQIATNAGKGFAVVANEIKELANQSADSAEDIARRIEGIQQGTGDAVHVISDVSEIIAKINHSVEAIAGHVEQQTKAANEIANNVSQANTGSKRVASAISEVARGANDVSRNAGEAAKGAANVSHNVVSVSDVAKHSAQEATQVNQSAEDLSKIASDLKATVSKFKV